MQNSLVVVFTDLPFGISINQKLTFTKSIQRDRNAFINKITVTDVFWFPDGQLSE